jgi:hypothetical protein
MNGDENLKEPLLKDSELGSPADAATKADAGGRIKGLGLTVAVAVFATAETAATSFATTSTVPQYTVNVVQCAAGMVTLWVIAAYTSQPLAVKRTVFMICMEFGLAFWFFLWGYVKALLYLPVVDVTAISVGISPIVSTVVGCFLLGESFSAYKAFVLVRNVAVVVIILGYPKAADESSMLQGFFWGVVMCIGTAVMRTSQRKIPTTPAVTTTFYGYAMNALMWLPPGGLRMRIPMLWPAEIPQDDIPEDTEPLPVWICMALGGILGALLIALQGIVLVYLDVGTYSMWVSPLYLMLTTVYQGFFGPLPKRVFAGIAIQAIGSILDFIMEQQADGGH